ncbi:glycosyltransferase [Candidatus Woesearchaeota archaeon]|nr:glycosyltransferase [Candidatus Woesearchaeota archaeon]
MKIKALVLTTSLSRYEGDYLANFIYESIRSLKEKEDVELDIIAPDTIDSKKYEKRNGINIYRFSYVLPRKYQRLAYGSGIAVNLKNNPLLYLQIPTFALGFLSKSLRVYKNHNIIYSQLVFAGMIGVLLRKILNKKIPVITTFWGKDVDNLIKNKKIYKLLIKEGDLFITLSPDMNKDLINAGCDRNKVKDINIGIDLKNFKYRKPKKSKKVAFLFVGRLIEKKGIKYAIEAFNKIKNNNFELRILGDGPLENELKLLVNKLGLKDKVIFISNKGVKDTRKLSLDEFNKADVFLLPSILASDGDKEGTPFVLMEAQAMGIPCISTYHAGIPYLVLDNKTGFLVKEKDVNSLANKMLKLAKDYNLRLKFSKAGRKHIEENYNQDKQIKKIRKEMEGLLKNGKL